MPDHHQVDCQARHSYVRLVQAADKHPHVQMSNVLFSHVMLRNHVSTVALVSSSWTYMFAEPMVTERGGASAAKDPAKMTIAELRTWLDEHNYQEKVWELGQKKAKKPEYVECVRELM